MSKSKASTSDEQLPEPPSHKYCDICWGSPNWKGMKFQRCKTCKVGVHNECYGISGMDKSVTDPNPDFECWACKSVGKIVKTRSYDEDGKRRCIKIDKRPTECCLCSVDDKNEWFHAMHPIYDREGVHGRQIVLPPTRDYPRYRLAWAHTVCAYAIYTHPITAGTVFACDAVGNFDPEEDLRGVELDDDYSVNTELDENDTSIDISTHHYGYVLPDKDGTLNPWAKRIKEHQDYLKCLGCGKKDNVASSFRIPLQCCANDKYENEDLLQVHRKTMKGTCYAAMHVGCAAFRRDIDHRLVFLFPGIVDDNTGERIVPTPNIFCMAHAKELDHAFKENKELAKGYKKFYRPTVYRKYYQKESPQKPQQQEQQSEQQGEQQRKEKPKQQQPKPQPQKIQRTRSEPTSPTTRQNAKSVAASRRSSERIVPQRRSSERIIPTKRKELKRPIVEKRGKGIAKRIKEDLENRLKSVNLNDADVVYDIVDQRKIYWKESDDFMGKGGKKKFKELWGTCWKQLKTHLKIPPRNKRTEEADHAAATDSKDRKANASKATAMEEDAASKMHHNIPKRSDRARKERAVDTAENEANRSDAVTSGKTSRKRAAASESLTNVHVPRKKKRSSYKDALEPAKETAVALSGIPSKRMRQLAKANASSVPEMPKKQGDKKETTEETHPDRSSHRTVTAKATKKLLRGNESQSLVSDEKNTAKRRANDSASELPEKKGKKIPEAKGPHHPSAPTLATHTKQKPPLQGNESQKLIPKEKSAALPTSKSASTAVPAAAPAVKDPKKVAKPLLSEILRKENKMNDLLDSRSHDDQHKSQKNIPEKYSPPYQSANRNLSDCKPHEDRYENQPKLPEKVSIAPPPYSKDSSQPNQSEKVSIAPPPYSPYSPPYSSANHGSTKRHHSGQNTDHLAFDGDESARRVASCPKPTATDDSRGSKKSSNVGQKEVHTGSLPGNDSSKRSAAKNDDNVDRSGKVTEPTKMKQNEKTEKVVKPFEDNLYDTESDDNAERSGRATRPTKMKQNDKAGKVVKSVEDNLYDTESVESSDDESFHIDQESSADTEDDESTSEMQVDNQLDSAEHNELVNKIFAEIETKENEGVNHLGDILHTIKSNWEKNLTIDTRTFQTLWDRVCDMVSKQLDYSFQKTDWKTVKSEDWMKWDTYEVLPIPPLE